MNKKICATLKENKILISVCIVLIIGILVRVLAINLFPKGLNVDEASSAYEAFSILNYGIDRNGNPFPIFLEAWGSGQNALYSYIIIPFIKLLGLNIISTRLPMAIIGCISLIIWYKLLKLIKDEKFALIGLIFLSICPWHIMKSRWGLESNVFPDLVLWAIYFIVKIVKTDKTYNLYIASVILALTGYSYGTSYMFLPIFCLILFVYLFLKKKIKIKNILISLSIIVLLDLPIITYVIINTFDLNQINLGFITIPKLPVNRYEEETSLFSGNIIINSFKNLKNSILLLITGDDGLAWNNISKYGMYYIISLPFLIIGCVFSFKKNRLKNDYDNIINIWFVSAFFLMFAFKEVNINRINILIFPIIYYIVNGINLVIFIIGKKLLTFCICVVYIIQFGGFIIDYINYDYDEYWTFTDNISDVIEYVDLLDVDKVYFEYAFKEPYIYVLYYTQCDVHEFIDTVQYFNENGIFDNVKSFGKYYFYLPDNLDEENCVYVISKDSNIEFEYDKFNIKEFEKYLILERK